MTTPVGPCSIPREDFDGGLAFQPWEVDRTHAPDCWDAQRIAALPTGERRDRAWLARRKHAPCCTKIPKEWGLDCIYLRLPEEESYARRLSALLRQPTTGPSGDVALNLVSFARPFLPPRWPLLSRPTWDPIREFPTTGHLRAPGDDVARDSAYALFRASGVAGLGDPGRFIREYRREKRDRRRKVLVSWSQVEFFELAAATRGSLYPALPDWWADVEVSTAMAVPLPPVLTYRGSGLIRGDPLHWAIFRSEWAVLVFGRWCADIHFRGIMWYLRPTLRDWIRQMGETELLEGSGLDVPTTLLALLKHDSWNWASSQEDDREDSRGVLIRCTQGDIVILEKGAEATEVDSGKQPFDAEWNPTPLDPPPWTLNSPMEPSRNLPITGMPPFRSAPPPEPRPDPAANLMPDGPNVNDFHGPRPAGGGGESSEFLRRLGAMEPGLWEEVWSYSASGVMDVETLATACRGMFVAMRTHSARAARLTRERDMLLRSRDEARFALELRAVRLRTLAQELGREAENLYTVEPRPESDRPLKRSHYDD